ncbi:MAG: DUF2007 domain-containing protein [Burkholderiales bacterium]
MKRVFSTLNWIEAHHMKALVESADISCLLRNEYLHRIAGEIPFGECEIELWVRNDLEADAAREVIAVVRTAPALPGPAWQCAGCGESCEPQFSACWQCGSSRPG